MRKAFSTEARPSRGRYSRILSSSSRYNCSMRSGGGDAGGASETLETSGDTSLIVAETRGSGAAHRNAVDRAPAIGVTFGSVMHVGASADAVAIGRRDGRRVGQISFQRTACGYGGAGKSNDIQPGGWTQELQCRRSSGSTHRGADQLHRNIGDGGRRVGGVKREGCGRLEQVCAVRIKCGKDGLGKCGGTGKHDAGSGQTRDDGCWKFHF